MSATKSLLTAKVHKGLSGAEKAQFLIPLVKAFIEKKIVKVHNNSFSRNDVKKRLGLSRDFEMYLL